MVRLNKCSCGEIPEIGRDDLERYLVVCVSCLKKSAPYNDMDSAVEDWNKAYPEEMRSYLDIIIDLQDGKTVPYEEARLAALAGNYMLQSAERQIIKLTGYATSEQKSDLQSLGAITAYESNFKGRKLPVDKYLGSFHPDYPGRQKERKMHQAIFDKFASDKKGE